MITPKQAIEAAKTGICCRIKHKTFLCQTAEAALAIRAETSEPYILIVDGDWSVPHGVADEHDEKLIEACNEFNVDRLKKDATTYARRGENMVMDPKVILELISKINKVERENR